jgi:hypothetical protein
MLMCTKIDRGRVTRQPQSSTAASALISAPNKHSIPAGI